MGMKKKDIRSIPIENFGNALTSSTSKVNKAIRQFQEMLKKSSLTGFNPSYYFSEEWFVLDGSLAIAIPYYIASPRLKKLHKSLGFKTDIKYSLIKYLAHEMGHAFDNAHRLARLKETRSIFGNASTPYSVDGFNLNKHYKKHKFVAVMQPGYAAEHPSEDFAETFAYVILNPTWRSKFKRGSLVFKKLSYMERLIKKYGSKSPKKIDRSKWKNIATSKLTVEGYINRHVRSVYNNF